ALAPGAFAFSEAFLMRASSSAVSASERSEALSAAGAAPPPCEETTPMPEVFAPVEPPPDGAEFAFVFSRETDAGGLFPQAARRSAQATRAGVRKGFCMSDDSREGFCRRMITRRFAGVTRNRRTFAR